MGEAGQLFNNSLVFSGIKFWKKDEKHMKIWYLVIKMN
jgi:hypothetical protein